MQVTTLGIDLAKNLFRMHGCDASGKVAVSKSLPSTAADICRDAATVPGRDGDMRDGALPGARDSEAPP